MTITAGPVFDSRISNLRYRIAAAGVASLLGRARYGSFAILSALTTADDYALRELVSESGYGFYRFFGLFAFAGPPHVGERIQPYALLVPALSRGRAREYAQVCGQDWFMWGHAGRWRQIRTTTDEATVCGNVETDFRAVHAARGRKANDLRFWCLPDRSMPAETTPLHARYWFYSWQIDHFPPVCGRRLFGIIREGELGLGRPYPALCDALVPLL